MDLKSYQRELEAKVGQIEEDLFLVKVEMKMQVFIGSTIVKNNPIAKKSIDDKFEVSQKEVKN